MAIMLHLPGQIDAMRGGRAAAGMGEFADLVADHQPFDIKRNIGAISNEGAIRMGADWYEYSTPGNIAYGFYGAAAGYDIFVLRLGAGAAQSKDAWIDGDGPPGSLGTMLDTPDDYYAVQFGYDLYHNYYRPDFQLTRDEFVSALATYEHRAEMALVVAPSDYLPRLGVCQ